MLDTSSVNLSPFFSCGCEFDDYVPFFPIAEIPLLYVLKHKPQNHLQSDLCFMYQNFVVNSISQPLCITFSNVLYLWSCSQDVKIVYFPQIYQSEVAVLAS